MPFPIYITEFPPFEEPDAQRTFSSSAQDADRLLADASNFIDEQRADFKQALTLAAEEIADNPVFPEKSPEAIEAMILKIHQISTRTLARKYPEFKKGLPGKIRTCEVFATKESTKESGYRKYNLEYPEDVFSILIYRESPCFSNPDFLMGSKVKIATDFIKFFAKWNFGDVYHDARLQLMESRIEMILRNYNYDVDKWRAENFSGKHLTQWVSDFFKENDRYSSTINSREAGNEKNETMAIRAQLPGLYSSDEIAARDKVIHVFPLSKELSSRMKQLTVTIVEMMRAEEDPVHIACQMHQAIAADSHFFANGNGRVARIMMNSILLHFRLPALQLETDLEEKREYYKAIEASSDNPEAFEKFIRLKIKAQQKRDLVAPTPFNLCVAARDGDIILTVMLLNRGVDPKVAPALVKGWTPLHYACAKGHFKPVMYLATHGADITIKNEAGKTPLNLIKSSKLRAEIPFIQKMHQQQQNRIEANQLALKRVKQ